MVGLDRYFSRAGEEEMARRAGLALALAQAGLAEQVSLGHDGSPYYCFAPRPAGADLTDCWLAVPQFEVPWLREVRPRLCIFEFAYIARPDSRLYGREVHETRCRMGELLAAQAPAEADLVMGVPESGVPAAEGFARASGIPYGQGLVKNRYIGRSFIAPDQGKRDAAVRRKLNPLPDAVAGKRLVVVDDSIVRGTTQRSVIRMLREAGAAEVHLRISSPPWRWPCFYGIDTPSYEELLATDHSIEDMARILGADSLAYISIENLKRAIGADAGFCDACFTGDYPTPVPAAVSTPVSLGRPERVTAMAHQAALPGV